MEPLKEYEIQEGQRVFLGAGLSGKEAEDILAAIGDNANIFAWKHSDMVGVDPCTAQYHLKMRDG